MSTWKKIGLGILIFISLILGTVILLTNTTSGLHLIFNTVNYLIPELEIDQITGNWKDLHLKNIRYQQPNITINVGELHLKIKLNVIHDNKLYIKNLLIKDLNATIDSKKYLRDMFSFVSLKEESKKRLNPFSSYLIVLHRAMINNINLRIHNTTISIIDCSFGVRWKENNLTLTPILLQGLLISLPKMTDVLQEKSIDIQKKNLQICKIPLKKQLKYFFSKPILKEIINVYLPINLNIEEFKGKQLRLIGGTNLTVFNMLVKANNVDNNVNLDVLNINTDKGSVNVKGNILLYDDWPLNITVSSSLIRDPINRQKAKIKIFGALREKLNVDVDLSGPVNMVLKGYAYLTKTGIPISFNVTSKQLFCSFINNKQFQVNDMNLQISGKINDYNISLFAMLIKQGTPSATITLDAIGNEQQINFNKIIITVLDGKIELTALVNWKQDISWCSDLKLININTTRELPNWPFKLNGLIKAQGSLYSGIWNIDIPKVKLYGSLKKSKVKVNGSVKSNSYLQWIIPNLHMSLGCNTLDVKGKFGVKNLYIDAIVDAPNLNNILPEVKSAIRGIIKFRGTVKEPQLLANITASNLCWKNFSISHIQINGDVKYIDQISGKFALHARNITQTKVNISSAVITVKGNEKQHDLHLYVHGNPFYGKLHLIGTFNHQIKHWKGQINHTQFNTSFGILKLSRSITLNYRNSEKKISIGPHCWINKNCKVCILHTIEAGMQGRIVIYLSHFDLETINPFISNTTQTRGVFVGKINLEWDATKKWLSRGHITLLGRNVKIKKILNEEPLFIVFDALNLNINFLHENSIQLFGKLKLNGVNINGNRLPFDMNPSQLIINFNGINSVFSGEMCTPQGKIILSGNADWSQINSWRAYIEAKGSNVRITVPSIMELDISPDLIFKITPHLFIIDGDIKIPWARIVVHNMPENAINISSDEILLSENLNFIKQKNIRTWINGNLIVHLGNNVRLDAFGLKTRITGDLKIEQNKKGIRLNGKINIPEGRFHSYGQDLIIRKGELLFSGSPDHLAVNIEAIRNPEVTEDNVIAGIRITGYTNELKTEVFSDSIMSKQEALSYLFRGQGLNSDQSDSTAITLMLIKLGVAQSEQVIGKIGKTFGVSNLVLNTQGTGNASQVVISGYLLPNLQVKYGIGIFDFLAAFTLRYHLIPKLYLEIISKADHTLNLIYRFEF